MAENIASDVQRMVVERIFDAPRELVWKAYTEPEYVQQWWGPHGFTSPLCRSDFRVGGTFLYGMKMPDGQVFYTAGEFQEIIPHEKIVYSTYFADAHGNKITSEQLGIEHEAIEGAYDTVLFEDLGEGRSKITMIGNEPMESARTSGQLEGVQQMLEKLAAVLSRL